MNLELALSHLFQNEKFATYVRIKTTKSDLSFKQILLMMSQVLLYRFNKHCIYGEIIMSS